MTKRDDEFNGYQAWLQETNPLPEARQARLFSLYFRKNFLPLIPEDPELEVLELGCGSGLFLAFLQEQGYRRARGIDIDPDSVAICRQKGLAVEVADMFSYLEGVASQSLELVVLNEVLEHLDREDARRLLLALRDKLRPEGRVFIKTPNCNNPYGLTTFFSDFTHLEGYAPRKLLHLALLCGYRRCECHNLYIYPGIPLVNELYSGIFRGWYWLKRWLYLANGKPGERVFSKSFLAVLAP